MPMNHRLMKPRRPAQPAFGFDVVQSYNPDIFYYLPDTPWATTELYGYGNILNLIQLADFHARYYLPFSVTWTILAAVYDPPVSPNSFLNYYAPKRVQTQDWGLPFGFQESSQVTETETNAHYNWNVIANSPGATTSPLVFNANGECIIAEKLLGDDSPWDDGRFMKTLGGVKILWYERQYQISKDPSKGAAWVVRREITFHNDEGKILGYDPNTNHSFVDRYYFATGYAAADMGANSPITDSYTPDVGNFPFVLSGGPPVSGWVA